MFFAGLLEDSRIPRTVSVKNPQRCPLCREQVTPTQARRLIACSACETVYHRSCFGEMGGCAVLGCQRSAQGPTASERDAKPLATSAPTKQATSKQVREADKPGPPAPLRVRRIALVAWILLLWLVGIVNIGLSLVPTLISVVYLAWRRSGAALVVFGLAPAVVIFGFNFTWGVVDYGRGTAVCRGFGLTGQEYSNLSPRLRCYRRSKGCTGNGQEFFTQEAYNIAVTKLIGLFGPMTGSYTGPYPTRASAYRALSEATCVIPVDKVKLIGEYKGRLVPGQARDRRCDRSPRANPELVPLATVFCTRAASGPRGTVPADRRSGFRDLAGRFGKRQEIRDLLRSRRANRRAAVDLGSLAMFISQAALLGRSKSFYLRQRRLDRFT